MLPGRRCVLCAEFPASALPKSHTYACKQATVLPVHYRQTPPRLGAFATGCSPLLLFGAPRNKFTSPPRKGRDCCCCCCKGSVSCGDLSAHTRADLLSCCTRSSTSVLCGGSCAVRRQQTESRCWLWLCHHSRRQVGSPVCRRLSSYPTASLVLRVVKYIIFPFFFCCCNLEHQMSGV